MNTTLTRPDLPPPSFTTTPLPPPPPPHRGSTPPPPPPGPRAVTRRSLFFAVLLVTAVGLAFADASVVALALPDIYVEFGTSIDAVSWVLTAYALAVAVAGVIGLFTVKRTRAATLTIFGAVVFAVSSLAAGLSNDLPALIGARVVQGVGGAALVAGALGVLTSPTGDRRRAARWWATAGVVGAVVGPALGGAVTQLFDWRAVFVMQAPIAALAAVGAFAARRDSESIAVDHERRPRGAMVADTALGLTFGALVGVLFLGVLMLVVVWGLPPMEGALVVSALPIGTVLAPRLTRWMSTRWVVVAGAAMLAGGLLTMANLPSIDTTWVSLAMAWCGLGFGAVVGALGPLALPVGSGVRAATLTSTFRHLGLVLGLALIAPLLGSQVMSAAKDAPLAATQTMLDSPVDGITKIRIALDIRDELAGASTAEVPDLDAVFQQNGAATDADVAAMQHDIETGVQGVVTKGFSNSYELAALFAVLAGVVGVGAVAMASGAHRGRRAGTVLAGSAVALAVLLPVAAVQAAEPGFGEVTLADPCTAPADPFPGGGFDAAVQRFVLSGLNGAACELGISREELVLSLEPRSGVDVQWDRDTIADALRNGVSRAIGDADDRGTLPGWLATALRWTVDHAPTDWFLEQLGVK